MAGTGLELFTAFVFAAGFFLLAAVDFLVLVDLGAIAFFSFPLPDAAAFTANPSFSSWTILLFFVTDFAGLIIGYRGRKDSQVVSGLRFCQKSVI